MKMGSHSNRNEDYYFKIEIKEIVIHCKREMMNFDLIIFNTLRDFIKILERNKLWKNCK